MQKILLRLRFGRFHHTDPICLGLVAGGDPEPLGGVNGVHGLLYPFIGHDVCHQRFDDDETELVHDATDTLPDAFGDVVFLLENVVEIDAGDSRSHRVLYIGPDLLMRITQTVESLNDVGFLGLVLDRRDYGDEDIVVGLCLARDVELCEAERDHASDSLTAARPQTVATWIGGPVELTTALNHPDLALRDTSAAKVAPHGPRHYSEAASRLLLFALLLLSFHRSSSCEFVVYLGEALSTLSEFTVLFGDKVVHVALINPLSAWVFEKSL